MDSLQSLLVAEVRRYASANYDMDGWDYIVECFSDEDILDAIGQAKTSKAAIRACGQVVKLHSELRADIQGEVF